MKNEGTSGQEQGEVLEPLEKSTAEKMWGPALPVIQAGLNEFGEELSDITIAGLFDQIYGREDKLDLKTRELCTITLLITLNRSEDLTTHFWAAINLGLTLKDISELMMLCTIANGWPSSLDALRILRQFSQTNGITLELGEPLRPDYFTADWYQRGCKKGEKLFGKKEWEGLLAEFSLFDPQLSEFMVSTFYGKFFSRTVLDDRIKEICLLSAFIVSGSKRYIRLHMIGALNCNVSAEEIKEIIFHVGLYAGQDVVIPALEVYKGLLR